MIWNKTVADDLVHETFCAVIESVPRLKVPDKINLWIFTIARRTLVKYQRKLYTRKKYLDLMARQMEQSEDLTEKLHTKQKLLLLQMLIDSLNPEYQRIYKMRYIDGTKIKAIADQIGRSEQAFANMLTRIKQTLKKEMKQISRDFFPGNGPDEEKQS